MNKEQWTCFEESEHATYMQKMLDGSSFPVLIRERGDRYTTLGHATCVSGAVAVYKKHIAVDERSEITASLRTEMGVELHGGPVGFLHSTKLKSGSRR